MKRLKSLIKNIPNHIIVAISGWASKIITALLQIINVRVLLEYLGEDKYAVYVIAYSLIGWFNLAEFGVGVSLQNFISEFKAKKESYEKYIIAALQLIIVLFGITLLITIFIAFPVQNIVFRKFSYISEIQNINIVLIIGIITLVSCFLSIVFKVYYALHKGYVATGIIPAISIIVSTGVIVIINRYSQKSNSILVALLVFTIPQLIFISFLFVKMFKDYFLKLLEINVSVLKDLIIRAIKFQGAIVASIAYVQSDYLVISQTLGASEIVEYNIFMKVFLFFSYAYTLFLAAFWPVSAEMYINKQFKELKSKIKKYLIYVTFFMTSSTVVIMFFSKFIASVLAPGHIIPATCFIILTGMYITVKAWQDTFVMFLQSINVLKIFWIYMPLQIIVNLILQYFLSKIYGVNGIPLGFIISTLCISIWVLFVKSNNILMHK